MRIVAAAGNVPIKLRGAVHSFRYPALRALVEHGDDGPDDFQVTELLRSDIDEHILAARIVLGEILREITTRRGQLPLGAAELLEHEVGEAGVTFADTYRVLQAFVVTKHDGPSVDEAGGAVRVEEDCRAADCDVG